jgi:hypothetical protein
VLKALDISKKEFDVELMDAVSKALHFQNVCKTLYFNNGDIRRP